MYYYQWIPGVHVSPSSVFAGDVKAMAAGFHHSMVLKADGTVWVTGENASGMVWWWCGVVWCGVVVWCGAVGYW